MGAQYTLQLSDPQATLESVGGKGTSLASLSRIGLPVPPGFHVTTQAYQHFIEANHLQSAIKMALAQVDAATSPDGEIVSQTIHALFSQAEMPEEIAQAVMEAYEMLSDSSPAVAVRSSATAEDLPEASFAGQQETYLNVRGVPAVLDAVKKCWASLWTARAIAYRIQHAIDHMQVELAVVVQEMVNADAAGVLFTANPMTGNREEIVINAAWGLGEAIVGGLVTPDFILADKATGKVKKVDVAEKTVITVSTEQGTQQIPLRDARRRSPVLNVTQISELIAFSRKIEAFYGRPQDIEWCQENGRFYIVQSRPITTLPEPDIPASTEWKLPKGSYAAVRNNIVELMADPLSPLFATLGVSAINTSLHRLLNESFGMQGIMPPEIIIVVNHYAYNNGSVSVKGLARMLLGIRKILRMMFTGAVERWTETGYPRYVEMVESWQAKNWHAFSAVELANGARQLSEAAIDAYGALVSGVIPAAWITEAIFTTIYQRLIKRRDDPPAPTFLLGFDSLPIRADQSLYSLAGWTLQHPMLANYLKGTPNSELIFAYREGATETRDVPDVTWQEWREQFNAHIQQYGHTLYDLDFMHPLPVDDPTPIWDALKLYLRGQGVDPYIRQRESAERRELATQAMKQRLQGWRLKWFSKYLSAAQKYAPLREDGLAEIGLAYPLIRQVLLELGERFAQRLVIAVPADIFWLEGDEVFQVAGQIDSGLPSESMVETITLRKKQHQAALSATPPKALPQMKLFGFDLMSLKEKRGRGSKGNRIKGVAASPGKVSGIARVIHDPGDFSQMQPGEVLVAPLTTPAWTPLFAMASAIVTDVGGPLSHGSIVAREYRIPAVLGTGVATRCIQDGQMITVDGSEGVVILV